MGITAVDVETTGTEAEVDRIIEIGAFKPETGEVFRAFINPHRQLPEQIVALTGITDEMLADEEDEQVVAERFLEFLGEDIILLGHNVGFDHAFLKLMLLRCGLPAPEFFGIDTLRISRVQCEGLPKKTLTAMCEHFGLVNERAHRAFEDAKAAWQLYEALREQRFSSEEGNVAAPEKYAEIYEPTPLILKRKKMEPITPKQRSYLSAILKQHGLAEEYPKERIDALTKSEASKLIDGLLSTYGRISYQH